MSPQKINLLNQSLESRLEQFNQLNLLSYAAKSNISLNAEAMAYLQEKSAKQGKSIQAMRLADIPNPKRAEYGLSLPMVASSFIKDKAATKQIAALNQKIEWKIKALREGAGDINEFKNSSVAQFSRDLVDQIKAHPGPRSARI